jgi:hypothetical protein
VSGPELQFQDRLRPKVQKLISVMSRHPIPET